MMAFFVVYGGITLIAGTVVFLDWLGRRKDRSHHYHA